MSLNPVRWPFAAKLAGVGVGIAALAGGITYAVSGPEGVTVALPQAAPSSPPSSSAPSPVSAPSSPPSGLSAGCQVGEGSGGFAPATQQNISDGSPAYQIQVTNSTGSPVTVSGFTVTFSAFGNTITSATPSVNAALMEPGENWNFPIDMSNVAGIQVSDNTWLNTDCTVTEVETADGPVTPNAVNEPNGQQNTRTQDIQNAQAALAKDVPQLAQDAASLDNDKSLGGDVNTMHTDLGTEQTDYQTEQAASCSDGSMAADAGAVGADAGAVGADLGALQADVTALQNSGVASVKTDLANIQSDLATLQNYGTAPATDSSAAVPAGNKALTDASNAISWANGQGNSINGEAQQLANTANSYSSSHGC
jgi:hypothetical protein